AIIGNYLNKHILITYHGGDFLQIKKSFLLRYLLSKYIHHAYYLGDHMESDLAKIHSNKLTRVSNGIDTQTFRDIGVVRKVNSFCAVGSLKPEKGFDLLV